MKWLVELLATKLVEVDGEPACLRVVDPVLVMDQEIVEADSWYEARAKFVHTFYPRVPTSHPRIRCSRFVEGK